MINKIILIGNAGSDAETRTLENGTKVARVSIATKESWKDKEGEWQSERQWHNLTMWRDLADRAENIKKGSLVYAEGKIVHRKYTDKDGIERNQTDIVVSSFRVLDKKEGNAKETEVPQEGRKEPEEDFGGLPF